MLFVSGVPQGSVLGPILFVLCTSDLSHVVDSQVYYYADDTTLVAPVQHPSLRDAVGDVLNEELTKVVDWCERWDMKLNPRKSKSFLVSRSRSELPPHPFLYANGDQIQEERHMKFLGVVLASKLTYEEYLRQVASRARQKTGILRKAVRLFACDSAILGRCLRAYVLPLVEYCSRGGCQQLRHIFHCLTEYSTLRLALAVMLLLVWLIGGVLVLCRCFGRFCMIAATLSPTQ